jgi:predicted TPR repeat methyltransferase
VLFKSGDSAAAVGVLEKALGFAPQSATAHFHLGMAQAQVGQQDAARLNLAAALRSGESFQGADEARAALEKLPRTPPPAPQS